MEATDEMIGYKPVSRLAVAAAVAGLLSSLALTTPLLWVLPLVGIAMAVAGLADVGRPGAEKAGRAAALLGLALSVGFGMQALTTTLVSRWIAEARAEAVVGAWLDAVLDERLSEARSMLAPDVLPPSPHDHGHGGPGHPDHSDDGTEQDEAFVTLPAVATIRRCGPAAMRDVQCTGRDEETGERWCVRVGMSPCGSGGSESVRLELVAATVEDPKRPTERWTIVKIDPGR